MARPFQLPLRFPPHILRQRRLRDLAPQLADLGSSPLAQLLLNRAELLAQEVPLRFVIRPWVSAAICCPSSRTDLALQDLDQPPQLRLDRLQLEDLLPRRAVQKAGRRDEIGHLSDRPRSPAAAATSSGTSG